MSTNEPIIAYRRAAAGSDRTFGGIIAAFFGIIGLSPWFHDKPVRWWALGIAGVFLSAAILAPKSLNPLHRIWLRLGLLLHKITNPLLMGLIYYAVLVPTGLLMRLRGKDPLHLNRDTAASTYWTNRDPPGPAPGSMTRQF